MTPYFLVLTFIITLTLAAGLKIRKRTEAELLAIHGVLLQRFPKMDLQDAPILVDKLIHEADITNNICHALQAFAGEKGRNEGAIECQARLLSELKIHRKLAKYRLDKNRPQEQAISPEEREELTLGKFPGVESTDPVHIKLKAPYEAGPPDPLSEARNEAARNLARQVDNDIVGRILKIDQSERCGFIPPTEGYGPCSRKKGHDGPCAHDFAEQVHHILPEEANQQKENREAANVTGPILKSQ